ncbi:MAG: adenylosuccinate lyase [Yoonia sp.]|uniref:adenylosuccinate lyase n=1 Tax=Rhodobacterales TaxID=204455 RepID=UPI001FF6334F|nr:adenylosuccinate lyase [Loktanella sp. F6476L]MCK0120795.1 adenylosuccinate lyase [Loktanella sp. F6476L]
MKIKLTIAALFIAISPVAAFAEGCHGSHAMDQQAAISCAEGMVFDADANTCVAETTS